MNRAKWVGLLLVVMAVSVTASMFAGGGHACATSAEECAKKMHAKVATSGWLGIETEKDAQGRWAISRVVPAGPAEAAGFRVGDVLAAINGVALDDANKEAVAKVKSSLRPGSAVTYTVMRQGGKLDLEARLAETPREVIAQKIGDHVLAEHLGVTVAAK